MSLQRGHAGRNQPKNMKEENQIRAVESLRDWSKWLIGIDFAAATGCVIVLQGGVQGPPRPFLMGAIAAFALSVITSVILVRALASLMENLPHQDPDGNAVSIYRYTVTGAVSVRQLANLQLGLLILGGLFFLCWVILKPAP